MEIKTFNIGDKKCVALIRKLTELECFRLMGVSDEDAKKMIASVSRSACYKLAGNSIVVDVLYHIYRKLLIEPSNECAATLFDIEEDFKCEYNHENPLRVVTLCSGYDAQCLALERLKKDFPPFDYELVAWSEFDPESKTSLELQPAVVAHNALFPQWEDRNLGDMTKIDWNNVPDFDLLTYSTPCQSISQAGLQHGFVEGSGTRSSIIWNVRDALRIKKPKYAQLENVAAMVSQKFLPMFNLWKEEVGKLGYENYGQLLNAKNYGVPQNRNRIFLISIREDCKPKTYNFPAPFQLQKKLQDVLEDTTDTKYYLNPLKVQKFIDENIVMIEKYARESDGEIEKLPDHLREWIESFPEEEENKEAPILTADPDGNVMLDNEHTD